MRHDAERILLVHAYPTDEVAQTGGTIAALIAHGVAVTVLTCTRGELAAIAPDPGSEIPGDARGIGELREREARIALSTLGVTDHRFLGDPAARRHGRPPRHYLDSGSSLQELVQTRSLARVDPASLVAAPMEEVAADLDAVVRQVQPTTIIVCDGEGGELRPDHVKVYQAVLQVADYHDIPVFAANPLAGGRAIELDVLDQLELKRHALAAHRSQLSLSGSGYRTTDGREHPVGVIERFRLVPVTPAEPTPRWPEPGASFWGFIGAVLLSLFAGLMMGLITTLNHQAKFDLLGLQITVGVFMGWAAIALLLAGIRLVTDRRAYTLVAGIGVLVVVAWLALRGIGGVSFVPDNARGLFWVTMVPLAVLLSVAWPSREQLAGILRRLRGRASTRLSGIMGRIDRNQRGRAQ